MKKGVLKRCSPVNFTGEQLCWSVGKKRKNLEDLKKRSNLRAYNHINPLLKRL